MNKVQYSLPDFPIWRHPEYAIEVAAGNECWNQDNNPQRDSNFDIRGLNVVFAGAVACRHHVYEATSAIVAAAYTGAAGQTLLVLQVFPCKYDDRTYCAIYVNDVFIMGFGLYGSKHPIFMMACKPWHSQPYLIVLHSRPAATTRLGDWLGGEKLSLALSTETLRLALGWRGSIWWSRTCDLCLILGQAKLAEA